MTDHTANCDRTADGLKTVIPELKGKVLVIHTKANGEISQSASGKAKAALDELRKQSREVDSWDRHPDIARLLRRH